jgi:hypothetical protein
MKQTLVTLTVVFAAVLARADLVVEQKIESPFVNGNTVTKIKGDNLRTDSPMPGGGSVSTIINAATGDATSLMHAQKMAMKMNLNAMQKQAQAAAGGAKTEPVKPKATGQTEKVGQYNAEIYEVTVNGQAVRMWSAKDYPNAKALKDQLNKIAKATSGGMYDPSQFEVPGIVVKTEINTPQGKVTTTLTGIREEAVADTEFQTPAGYQSMDMPKLPPQK